MPKVSSHTSQGFASTLGKPRKSASPYAFPVPTRGTAVAESKNMVADVAASVTPTTAPSQQSLAVTPTILPLPTKTTTPLSAASNLPTASCSQTVQIAATMNPEVPKRNAQTAVSDGPVPVITTRYNAIQSSFVTNFLPLLHNLVVAVDNNELVYADLKSQMQQSAHIAPQVCALSLEYISFVHIIVL